MTCGINELRHHSSCKAVVRIDVSHHLFSRKIRSKSWIGNSTYCWRQQSKLLILKDTHGLRSAVHTHTNCIIHCSHKLMVICVRELLLRCARDSSTTDRKCRCARDSSLSVEKWRRVHDSSLTGGKLRYLKLFRVLYFSCVPLSFFGIVLILRVCRRDFYIYFLVRVRITVNMIIIYILLLCHFFKHLFNCYYWNSNNFVLL